MKHISLKIISFSIFMILFVSPVSAAQTANAILTWDSNIEADINKYVMNMGVSPGVYDTTLDIIHAPLSGTQTGTFSDLSEGVTYFFAVKACDNSGNCSGFSNEVSKLISIPPGIPGNLNLVIDINISITVP